MPYNRGDIVLALFPNSDLRTAKRRPALIVQTENIYENRVEKKPIALLVDSLRDSFASRTFGNSRYNISFGTIWPLCDGSTA